jgi:hypothetical protein
MKINHFQIARWGTATIHWDGTAEEIAYFRSWVKRVIPDVYVHWYDGVGDPAYDAVHAAGNFDLGAWVEMCIHWCPIKEQPSLAVGQVWKENQPDYPYETTGNAFGATTCLNNYDRAVLQLAAADLEKTSKSGMTQQRREAIRLLRELANQLPHHDHEKDVACPRP